MRSRSSGESGEKVRKIVKELFPVFIRTYLLDEESHYRQIPTDTAPLAGLLDELKVALADHLVVLFAQHWPPEAAELTSRSTIEQTIDQTANELATVIKRLHRRLEWAKSTRAELHRKKDAGPLERKAHEPIALLKQAATGSTSSISLC